MEREQPRRESEQPEGWRELPEQHGPELEPEARELAEARFESPPEPPDKSERIEEIREELAEAYQQRESEPPRPARPPIEHPINPRSLSERLQADRLNVLVENARHILGPEASDEAVKDLARRTFREYGRAIKFMFLEHHGREELLERSVVVGKEHLEHALAKNGRAIVATSHMSYFPAGMRMIPGLLPERARASALVEKNPLWPVMRLGQQIGRFLGFGGDRTKRFEILVKDSKNPKTLMSVIHRLKRGSAEQRELFFMAADRGDLSPDRRRTPVKFFDTEVQFPTGPATLARHADASVVPAYIVREGDRFELRIGAPLELDRSTPEEEAQQKLMQQVADFFAEGIRKHPEQWPVYRHDYWPEQPGTK